MKQRFKSIFTAVLAAAALTVWACGAAPAFTDVAAGAYYYDAVQWAVKNGVTTATTFSPNNPCTRAQIVTFLYRDLGTR